MDNIEDLKQQITNLEAIVNKQKNNHNKNCLKYYHTHKDVINTRRNAKYTTDTEYADKIRQKRRERYQLAKNNLIQEKS